MLGTPIVIVIITLYIESLNPSPYNTTNPQLITSDTPLSLQSSTSFSLSLSPVSCCYLHTSTTYIFYSLSYVPYPLCLVAYLCPSPTDQLDDPELMATILVTDRNKRSDSKRFLIFDTVAWRQPGFAAPPMPSMLSREPSIAFSLPPYPLSREPSMTSTTSNNNNNGNQTPTQSTRAVTILEPLNESTKSLLTVGKEE